MTTWDVSTLVGARVLFPAEDDGGNAHEARGTIVAVLEASAADDETDATNGTTFSVKTDAGKVMTVAGSSFSRIDSVAGAGTAAGGDL